MKLIKLFKQLFKHKPTTDTAHIWKSVKPKVNHLYKSSVRLYTTEITSNSKLGGKPCGDSLKFEWPEVNGKPLAFLAQIDLCEVAQTSQFDWLPDSGHLLFFYDVLEQPWGFNPDDKSHWKVIYQDSETVPIEFPTNLSKSSIFKESYLTFKKEKFLPDLDSPEISNLKLSDDEADAYIDCKVPSDDIAPNHKVGGYAQPIQGNYMQLESQLASNGIDVGEPQAFTSDKAKILEPGASEWQLLLQIDGDDKLDMMWGDCGTLYFWVEKSAAKSKNFENVWLILQCC